MMKVETPITLIGVHVRLEPLELRHADDLNERSQAAIARLGAVLEGVLRKATVLWNGASSGNSRSEASGECLIALPIVRPA